MACLPSASRLRPPVRPRFPPSFPSPSHPPPPLEDYCRAHDHHTHAREDQQCRGSNFTLGQASRSMAACVLGEGDFMNSLPGGVRSARCVRRGAARACARSVAVRERDRRSDVLLQQNRGLGGGPCGRRRTAAAGARLRRGMHERLPGGHLPGSTTNRLEIHAAGSAFFSFPFSFLSPQKLFWRRGRARVPARRVLGFLPAPVTDLRGLVLSCRKLHAGHPEAKHHPGGPLPLGPQRHWPRTAGESDVNSSPYLAAGESDVNSSSPYLGESDVNSSPYFVT